MCVCAIDVHLRLPPTKQQERPLKFLIDAEKFDKHDAANQPAVVGHLPDVDKYFRAAPEKQVAEKVVEDDNDDDDNDKQVPKNADLLAQLTKLRAQRCKVCGFRPSHKMKGV